MTCYVDDMYKHPMGRFGRMKMSHMVADTEEELHAMAKAIGMQRRWYQGDHYDVSLGLRAKAVALGAVQIELKTCSMMCFVRRHTGQLPSPDIAREEWVKLKSTQQKE